MLKPLFFLISLLYGTFAFAVEVTDLYQAKVLVEGQTTSQRNIAIKQAMAAVILKIGGQESVLNDPIIKQELNRYNQYVTKYRYERIEQALYLIATFNENKINQLFQQANLPIWGNLRPQILVWLVLEDNLSRSILSESSQSTLPAQIAQFTESRGLPTLLPLMDLEDNLKINVTDFWGRFSDEVQLASARYFADASLIIRLSNSSLVRSKTDSQDCQGVICPDNVQYAMDWSLIGEQQLFGSLVEGNDPNELLDIVLKEVANTVYQFYASSTEFSNELLIDVANIDSLTTYVQVYQFLSQLSAVESVTLVQASQEKRRFKLSLLGAKKALLASLKLNDQLQQYVDPLAGAEPIEYPLFYWRR
ncbi:DUF2066 domain-containing protein [Colwellia sp. MEBiC06753]